MRNRRMTRLTNGFSKKLETHIHAASLFMMAYDFLHAHYTLTKDAKGVHPHDCGGRYGPCVER